MASLSAALVSSRVVSGRASRPISAFASSVSVAVECARVCCAIRHGDGMAKDRTTFALLGA